MTKLEAPNEQVTYDPDALPSEVDVETLFEVRSLRDGLTGVNESLQLLAQGDGGQTESVTSEVTISGAQYEYLQRSMQLTNSLSLVMMLMLGVACGLLGWQAFTHSWGSHG